MSGSFGHDGREWADWSHYTWPDLSVADFMPGTMTIDDLRALETIGAAVYVALPRQGTAPEARLIIRESEVRAVCAGEDWLVVPDRAPYLLYCERLAPRLTRTITLGWDRVQVQFMKQ
jgi:hypothetical protein